VGDQVFSNNASSLLAASIDNIETVIQVEAGFGALFPNPGASEFFKLRLVNATGDIEICSCTERTSDLLTVVRAQEGTIGIAWTLGATRVELSNTAVTMEQFIQRDGDTMEGNLAMGGNSISAARIGGSSIFETGQSLVPMRGTEDDASNEISVPTDGSRATAGGSPILTQSDGIMQLMPIGSIILWNAGLGSRPDEWELCDGNNGTPDLTDLFVRGAGGSYTLGDDGGSATASGTTDENGDHEHPGDTEATVLEEDEMPAHHHRVYGNSTGHGGGITAVGLQQATSHSVAGFFTANVTDGYSDNVGGIGGDQILEDTGSGNSHKHANQGEAGDHTHGLGTVETIPPFRAIYYIMKVV
jgi:hypothetical protein